MNGNYITNAGVSKRYAAVYDTLNRRGEVIDTETYFFDSGAEATAEARDLWWYLTAAEKKRSHIYSALVTLEDLTEDAYDRAYLDEGEIDWGMFSSLRSYDGDWDSDTERGE